MTESNRDVPPVNLSANATEGDGIKSTPDVNSGNELSGDSDSAAGKTEPDKDGLDIEVTYNNTDGTIVVIKVDDTETGGNAGEEKPEPTINAGDAVIPEGASAEHSEDSGSESESDTTEENRSVGSDASGPADGTDAANPAPLNELQVLKNFLDCVNATVAQYTGIFADSTIHVSHGWSGVKNGLVFQKTIKAIVDDSESTIDDIVDAFKQHLGRRELSIPRPIIPKFVRKAIQKKGNLLRFFAHEAGLSDGSFDTMLLQNVNKNCKQVLLRVRPDVQTLENDLESSLATKQARKAFRGMLLKPTA